MEQSKTITKRLKRIRNLKLKYLFVCFVGGGYKERWLRKHCIFGMMGDNVLFQPRILPNEPELVKLHDNVRIASNVTFYTHDVINNLLFSTMDGEEYSPHRACIEIFENVFVGGHTVIIGGVKIGPNAIVGAGSVVTKNVPEGTVVAGNPARIIGSFDEFHKKRINEALKPAGSRTTEQIWNDFYDKKENVIGKNK